MYWDIDIFLEIQRSYPTEDQPLVYAALNACVSAWSLEQWAEQAWKREYRSNRKSVPCEFRELVSQKIPAQDLCCDIANTAKHAAHREERWPNGELTLKWNDGDEASPPGLMLLRSEGNNPTLLHSDFFDLPRDWWNFLREQKLVSGDQPTPKWWQKKISRIFGEVSKTLTPPSK
ncbi:MAG: hypothetical protein KAT26_10195 [Marinosulfonomonas sp.]|nr:hypothetical protein [Marinosulfonomonas sp.]